MGHVLANCLSPTHFSKSLAEGDRYIKKAVKRLGMIVTQHIHILFVEFCPEWWLNLATNMV